VAWIEGKPGLRDELLKPVRNDPLVEQWALKDDALIAAYEGRFATARELEREALDGCHRIDRAQAGWVHVAEAGVREGLAGNTKRAREDARESLDHDASREVRGAAAVALAIAGDTQEATRIADELAAQYPQATIVQRHYLPAIRGAMALDDGRPADALQALQPAEAYELGVMGEVALPLYLRGEAYLGLKDGQRAADVYTKLTHDCPYPGTFPCALANLELARAYAMLGETGKARTAYSGFFALWKQADRDIPLLKPARLELGRLNGGDAAVAQLRPVD
jgi:eukaryotic-like serine/threonine-protein kinase